MSSQWVLQSAKLGQRQRCLEISADTARSLSSPIPVAVTGAQESKGGISATLRPSTSSADRQILVDKLIQSSIEDLHPQISVPASLLNGVAWAVTNEPSSARKEGQGEAVKNSIDT